ncbi:hypothetical protein [Limnohabitans lacus]|uniref:Bacteriophage tail tape measure C-terminal domain-containing protein n=1 Tax=Limnohabitans lacus TaxID=3045173 RepID=A0ABT6X846_9BURK|nr:hypothetical protein [Limnohabitans sp. HM2-2]MDI9234312.1 hypothetical protein [Limnohabitans sp. HM2-2]
MTDNITGFRVDANINPFEASMRRLVDSAKAGQGGVGAALGGLAGGPLAGLQAAFAGIAAVLSGGIFVAGIRDTAAMTVSAMDLSRALGITTNEAKAVQMAMEDIGAQTGEFEGAAKGMTRQLRENESVMNKLGLVTRDASGHLRPLNDLVLDGIQVLGTYKEGTDRTMAAQALFGRGIDASSKLMLYNRDVLDENKATMVEMGLEVGENAVKAWGEYDSAMDRAGFGMQGIKKAIGDSLMPIMTTLVNMFNAVMPAAIAGARIAFSSLTAVFLTVKVAVVQLAEVVSASLFTLVEPIRGIAEALYKIVTGDFSGAVKAVQSIGQNVGAAWQGSMNRMTYASKTAVEDIKRIFSQDVKVGNGGGPGKGGKEWDGGPTKPKEPSQMPIYEAELAKKIALFEKEAQAQGTLRQYSKAEEAAYWKEVSNRAGVSAEDKARAEKKWRDLERGLRTESFTVEMADLEQRKQAAQNNYAERITLAEQAHAKTAAMYGADSKEAAAAMGKVLEEKRKQVLQLQQLDDIGFQRKRDKALADVEFDRQDAEHKLAMGLMTQEQLLVQQTQFEERMHAIKLQYLQQALLAVDPQKDPIKKAEIDAQIEQLELQHQLRLKGIKGQIAATQAGPELNMFKSMESSFESAITGMLTRAQTLREGLANIFKSTTAVFAQEMISKPLAMVAARVIRESALYKMLSGAAISNQALASGTTTALVAGETAPKLAAIAPVAAGKAAESQAGIPYIGPVLAAAAFAAMMSMVMGSKGGGGGTSTTTTRIPSASRGFDIPRGLNPLTQLHEQEMVLPAHLANPLRDSLAQGGPTGQGGDGGTVVINTTGGDFIHKRDLAKLLTTMKRDYRLQG